tara:strand:- start:71956 stop:72192 length:237 start_codon:yes stop_codon:yes gene_type:complete
MDCETYPFGFGVFSVSVKVFVTGANCQIVTVKAWPLSQTDTIDRDREACLSWPTRKRDTWSEKTGLLTQINNSFAKKI